MRLEAAGEMQLRFDDQRSPAALHVGWGEADWLGPGRALLPGAIRFADRTPLDGHDEMGAFRRVDVAATDELSCSMRAYDARPLVVFRIEALRDLQEAGASFDRPAVAWPLWSPNEREPGGIADGAVVAGFQYTEFAWPTTSDAAMARFTLWPFRPAVVMPLLVVAPDGRTMLAGPLDSFHEQVIAVSSDGDPSFGVACGWHGDLDDVAAGFASELALLCAPSPRSALRDYGALVRARHNTTRPGRYADALGSQPSYWTDNGSAYWYRTEPGRDTTGTLVAAVDDLRARGIPIDAVQLDSWWYPHEVLRPFDTDDWVVPPTGLLTWEPRADVFPDGVEATRKSLGDPPLVTHCRHVSAQSPYVEQFPMWVDGERAHPSTAALYEHWLDRARSWGVETFEHDWLVESFLGVRDLRRAPGRARAWQEGIDRAATEREMTLQWCMGTPADFLQSVTLRSLTSIRTSGDTGYLFKPGQIWAWFLMVNTLARALDLVPYKDVMLTDAENPSAHPELEALLASLSTGPVGIGDPVGRAAAEIVRRTCRADGLLVKPDVPIAAVDAAFAQWSPGFHPILAETYSDHPAGRWHYVLALNPAADGTPRNVEVDPRALGATNHLVWDWRKSAVVTTRGAAWATELPAEGWEYLVLVPRLAEGRIAIIGDTTLYAVAGDRRVRVSEAADGVQVEVYGPPGEEVTITGWEASAGVWHRTVEVGAGGTTTVEVV